MYSLRVIIYEYLNCTAMYMFFNVSGAQNDLRHGDAAEGSPAAHLLRAGAAPRTAHTGGAVADGGEPVSLRRASRTLHPGDHRSRYALLVLVVMLMTIDEVNLKDFQEFVLEC